MLRVGAEGEQQAVALQPAPPGMVPPDPRGLPAYEVELPDRVLHVRPTHTEGGMLLEVRGLCACWVGGRLLCPALPAACTGGEHSSPLHV